MVPNESKSGVFSRPALWSDTAVLYYLGLANLLVHLAVNGRYGFFRDELYSIVCGERLAFGYVDHPPLTPLFARLSRLLFGESLFGLRIFPALAGAATVILAGLIVRKLGGGRFAQVLAAASVFVSAVLLNFGYMLTNNAFDLVFWTLAAFTLTIILKENRPRLWLAFGAVVGIALQNKYSLAFFVAALGIGLLLSSARRQLRTVWPWAGGGVALLIFLPNFIWQVRHGLPFIELNRNAVQFKNAVLSPLQFLRGQFWDANPLVFLIVLAGLFYFLLAPAAKPFRVFGWAYLVLLAFFIFSGGKTYYIAPVYPVMAAGGAIAVERFLAGARTAWLKPVFLVLLAVTGAVVAPFVIPVLPVSQFVAYSRHLGVTPTSGERQRMGVLPQHFADQFGWREMTETVARVYGQLPESERKVCGIYAQNYGEASAINVFGRKYNLPPAISGHNNYWVWGPGRGSGEVMIIIGGNADDHRHTYSDVREAARHFNPYAMPYESDLPIFVCRGLKVRIGDVWPSVRHFI